MEPLSGVGSREKYCGLQFYFINSRGEKYERIYPLYENRVIKDRGNAFPQKIDEKYDLLNKDKKYWFSKFSGNYGDGYILNAEELFKDNPKPKEN